MWVLINKDWYGMFCASEIWCAADVSSDSPSSEQTVSVTSIDYWARWEAIIEGSYFGNFQEGYAKLWKTGTVVVLFIKQINKEDLKNGVRKEKPMIKDFFLWNIFGSVPFLLFKILLFIHNTVRPPLSSHLRDFEKWPLIGGWI